MSRVRRHTRPDRMQPDEFEKLCRSVFGPFWKKPASRALDRDPKMIRRYLAGTSVIPAEIGAQLHQIASVGEAELLIRGLLKSELPGRSIPNGGRESPELRAHNLAVRIAEALRDKRLLAANEPKLRSDQLPCKRS